MSSISSCNALLNYVVDGIQGTHGGQRQCHRENYVGHSIIYKLVIRIFCRFGISDEIYKVPVCYAIS